MEAYIKSERWIYPCFDSQRVENLVCAFQRNCLVGGSTFEGVTVFIPPYPSQNPPPTYFHRTFYITSSPSELCFLFLKRFLSPGTRRHSQKQPKPSGNLFPPHLPDSREGSQGADMSGGDVVCSGWLRKSPPEKKLRRYVSTLFFIFYIRFVTL